MAHFSKDNRDVSNRLLLALSADDLRLIKPHLEYISLPRRHQLEFPNRDIEALFFIELGMASVVVAGNSEAAGEIGVIGNEGVSGIPVILGGKRSPNSVYMQSGGGGFRIDATTMRKLMRESETLRDMLSRYVLSFLSQTGHTASANVNARAPVRLARWLLMAHDRAEGDTLHLTHDFLAIMLGMRRPGVTETIHSLCSLALISNDRGEIHVLNRPGLEAFAGKFYGVPEKEYARLIESNKTMDHHRPLGRQTDVAAN